jgi:hypothetical protein
MDIGTTVSVCAGICIAGGLILKFVPKKITNGITRIEMNKAIESVKVTFKEVVFKDACSPNRKKIDQKIDLVTNDLAGQVKLIREDLRVGLQEIKQEIRNGNKR